MTKPNSQPASATEAKTNIGGSILPSSSPEILKPIFFKTGLLQVIANVKKDTHELHFIGGKTSKVIASHPNGFSCHSLADRMKNQTTKRAIEQAEYIVRCGGKVNKKLLSELIEPTPHPASANEAKATARPWRVLASTLIEADALKMIADCDHYHDSQHFDEVRANAELIVRAVNEHDALESVAEAAKEIEWAAVRKIGGLTVSACPCCYQGNPVCLKSVMTVTKEYALEKLGHDKNCSLANALTNLAAVRAGKGAA